MGTSKIKATPIPIKMHYDIPAQSTKTFEIPGIASLILIKRQATNNINVLLSVEFWASGYITLFGSVSSSDMVITKNENSYDITIQNKKTSSLGIVIM